MNNNQIHGIVYKSSCAMHGNKKTLQNYPPLFCVRGTVYRSANRALIIVRTDVLYEYLRTSLVPIAH